MSPPWSSVTGSVVWQIRKDHFEKGIFDVATYELGGVHWSLHPITEGTNPLQGDVASFMIDWKWPIGPTEHANVEVAGIVTLLGAAGRFNVTVLVDDTHRERINLKIDNSTCSFDAKYLCDDACYRIEFKVTMKTCYVDFAVPNHALIAEPSENACIQVDGKKIYLSKLTLSDHSPVFKARFREGERVIRLPKIKLESFMQFIAHLYLCFRLSDRLDHNHIAAVLKIATEFSCMQVVDSCAQMLEAKEAFAISDLALADKYDFISVQHNAVASLPIDQLKKYLEKIAGKPECNYTRLLILQRIEEDVSGPLAGPSEKRVRRSQ